MAVRRKSSKRGAGDRFREASNRITNALGTPWALLVAVVLILGWGVTGPIFGFSDTWQLVINTATTIVTFLMVFVIQTSQNRTAKATQFKLDELIKAMPGARNRMIAAEQQSEEQERRDERAFELAARKRDSSGSNGKAGSRQGRQGSTPGSRREKRQERRSRPTSDRRSA